MVLKNIPCENICSVVKYISFLQDWFWQCLQCWAPLYLFLIMVGVLGEMSGIPLLTLADSVCLFEVFTKIPPRIFTFTPICIHWGGPPMWLKFYLTFDKYLLLTLSGQGCGLLGKTESCQHLKYNLTPGATKIFNKQKIFECDPKSCPCGWRELSVV